MEVLNKILPLILTAIMSMNLSGCGNSTGANGIQTEETSSRTIATTENKELKHVSVEEFANSLYVEGKHIPFPCTFGELCDSFDFDRIEENNLTSRKLYRDTGLYSYSYNLYFSMKNNTSESTNQGHIRCQVLTESPNENKTKILESNVIWMYYISGEENFEICGLSKHSNFDDMVSVLGEAYAVNDWLAYEYSDNNTYVCVDLNAIAHMYNDYQNYQNVETIHGIIFKSI